MAKYIPLKAIKDMKDFLQRSDKITKFNKPWTEKMKEYRKGQYSILDWLLDDLDKTTVEIEDRPKGKWIDNGQVREIGGYSADCSVCGEWSEYLTNFCGNCGADMR